jgi:hypothetical protein
MDEDPDYIEGIDIFMAGLLALALFLIIFLLLYCCYHIGQAITHSV